MRWRLAPVAVAAWLAMAPVAIAQTAPPEAGPTALTRLLEGADTVLGGPGLILPVLALALMLGLWETRGLRRGGPAATVGALAGVALAPFSGPWVGLAVLGVGALVGGLAALVPLRRLGRAIPLLAAMLMAMVLASALEGNPFGEVTMATRVGAFVATLFALGAAAGLVTFTRRRWPHPVVTILWRVAASWVTAILLIYLAYAYQLGF